MTGDYYQPKHVWTLNERSFLWLFYKWLYNTEIVPSFCRLFWGMIVSPISLVIRLVGLVLMGIGHAIAWPFIATSNYRLNRRRRRLKENMEWWEEWRKKADPYYFSIDAPRVMIKRKDAGQYQTFQLWERIPVEPPKPKKVVEEPAEPVPNAPQRFADAVAAVADHIVSWFQEHPQIGVRIDGIMSVISWILLRCVFWPLMILVPLTAVLYAGYEVWGHRDGALRFFHCVWGDSINGLNTALDNAWKPILFSVGAGLSALIIIGLICWMLIAAEKLGPPPEDTKMYYVMGAGKPAPRIAVLAGKSMSYGAQGFGWFVVALFMPIYWFAKYIVMPLALGIGRGTRTTFQFFVLGHHSVKNRTCPRIEVRSES